MLALVVCARVYDQSRGVSFRRSAAFRIRGALIDELRGLDWASRSVRSRSRLLQTARANLAATLDRRPGIEDIAGALGISAREVGALSAEVARGNVLSLESLFVDALPAVPAGHRDCPESLIKHREKLVICMMPLPLYRNVYGSLWWPISSAAGNERYRGRHVGHLVAGIAAVYGSCCADSRRP